MHAWESCISRLRRTVQRVLELLATYLTEQNSSRHSQN